MDFRAENFYLKLYIKKYLQLLYLKEKER